MSVRNVYPAVVRGQKKFDLQLPRPTGLIGYGCLWRRSLSGKAANRKLISVASYLPPPQVSSILFLPEKVAGFLLPKILVLVATLLIVVAALFVIYGSVLVF